MVSRFIAFIDEDAPPTNRSGVIAEKLFLPSPSMRQFHDAALKLRGQHNISHVEKAVPPECFKTWFLDWVLPRSIREQVLERDGSVVRLKVTTAIAKSGVLPNRSRTEKLATDQQNGNGTAEKRPSLVELV